MERIPFGSRTVIIVSLHETAALKSLSRPFAILLSTHGGFGSSEQREFVTCAVDRGCMEICCAGDNAERLHDWVDEIVEDREALHVATTWHSDETPSETMYYFLHLAGQRPENLVAAIGSDPQLLRALREAIDQT